MSEKMTLPVRPEEITAGWLTEALRAGGVIGEETAVQSLTVEPLGGAGYLGCTIRLYPTYDRAPQNSPASFIAKLPHPDPEMRQNVFWSCEREIFFYQELAPITTLNTPVCYYSDIDLEAFRAVLLFEDLGHLQMIDLAQGSDLATAHTVVSHLARHHAQWWQDPRLPEWEAYIKPVNERWDGQEETWRNNWVNFEANIAALLPNSYMPASFLAMGERASHQILNLNDQMAERPFTFLHGDTHLDNMMFANDTGDPELTVFDWQLIKYGPGVCDLSYFLILCLPVSLRRQVEHDLLHAYHEVLLANGVDDYSLAACWRDYRLSFFHSFDLLTGVVEGFDMTGEHGRSFIGSILPRVASFAEDHHVVEFLR